MVRFFRSLLIIFDSLGSLSYALMRDARLFQCLLFLPPALLPLLLLPDFLELLPDVLPKD